MKVQAIRVAATVLWFAAAWSGFGMIVGLAAMPSALAVVGGIAVAMLVWFDPMGRLWRQPATTRRVRPIEELAAELQGQAASGAREAVERLAR